MTIKRTPEGCEEARRLLSEKWTLNAIGKKLGIHPCMVRCWADPEYAAQRNFVKHSPAMRVQRIKWGAKSGREGLIKDHPINRVSVPYVKCLEGKEAPTFQMVRR